MHMRYVAGLAICTFIAGWGSARLMETRVGHGRFERTSGLSKDSPQGAGAAATSPPATSLAGTSKVPESRSRQNDSELVASIRDAIMDPNKLRKQRAVLDLLEHLTPENAAAVRDVFLAFRKANAKEDFAWAAFWTRWGQIDGPAALEYAANAHSELGGSGAGTNAMEGFIENDSVSGREWLATHSHLPSFDVFARVYVERLAKTDIAAATQDLFSLPLQPEQRYDCFGPIIREALNARGVGGVQGWFAQLNDLQKKEAFVHTVWAMRDSDLDAVTSWYSAQADKPWRDDKHLDDIVRRYTQRDPASAIEWLLSLPPSSKTGQLAGLPMAIDTWAKSDATTAGTWLLQNIDQPWFTKAASGYVRGRRGTASEGEFLQALSPNQAQAVMAELRN
jgi:hypothetical protein